MKTKNQDLKPKVCLSRYKMHCVTSTLFLSGSA
ncbi:MAG: hypothetical protein JWN73_530 [Betaproteobacteria bacterium]|nr:hypothetical protein [Betaproteobacteria bacterium]